MKVLIIGAKGMLGQELAAVFQNQHPFLLDREELDITDEKAVQQTVHKIHPDVIINAAAYNDVDGAEGEPERANLINGKAVGYLAKAAKNVSALFVHYSTDYIFRGDKREGYMEDDIPEPLSAYGKSKYLGEQEVLKLDGKFYLIRTSRLFGREAVSPTAKRSFIYKMIELSKKQDTMQVIDEEVSSPTYTKDLAIRTKEVIDWEKPFGIYHATNVGACTWYELAREIFTIKHIDGKLNPVQANYFPRSAVRPKHSILLNTKLPPMRPWQEAFHEFITTNL